MLPELRWLSPKQKIGFAPETKLVSPFDFPLKTKHGPPFWEPLTQLLFSFQFLFPQEAAAEERRKWRLGEFGFCLGWVAKESSPTHGFRSPRCLGFPGRCPFSPFLFWAKVPLLKSTHLNQSQFMNRGGVPGFIPHTEVDGPLF